MSFVPLTDQRTWSVDPLSDCFPASLWMVLNHVGRPVTQAEILNVHAGTTDIPTALLLCQRFGLQASTIKGGVATNDALTIVLFHDNELANPDVNGPFEHFGVVYDQPPGGVQMANPWGGRDIFYPLSQFDPAEIEGIVVRVTANTPAPAPTPVASTSFALLGG